MSMTKEWHRNYQRERMKNPQNREKANARKRAWNKTEHGRAVQAAYNQRNRERIRERRRNRGSTPHRLLYTRWKSMVARCTDPNSKYWKFYGARGIKVCERWLDFKNYAADTGHRPPGMMLDRINNDGNYEPSNVRWATPLQSSNNTRSVKLTTFDGKTLSITGWSRETGIGRHVIRKRMRSGESMEQILRELYEQPKQ